MNNKPLNIPPALCLSLVLALASIVCIGALSGKFVSDDRAFLVDNPRLESVTQIPLFFSQGMWEFSTRDTTDESLYRPAPLSIWCLMKALGARQPITFHLVNAFLHILNTALVWLLLVQFFRGKYHIALVGAGLFAVHPIHVEAICWISAMSHLLGTSFFLGSLLTVVQGVTAGKNTEKHNAGDYRRTVVFVSLASLLALLGQLSQETCIGIAGVVLVYAVVLKQRRVMLFVLGTSLATIVYLVLRTRALGAASPVLQTNADAVRQLVAYTFGYLSYLVFPWPQALFLDGPGATFFGGLRVLCSLLIVTGIIALIVKQRTARWCLLLAVGWLVITLFPPVVAALHPSARFALRSLYLPSVGMSLVVSAGLTSRWLVPTKASLAIVLVIAIGLALMCMRETRSWRNEEVMLRRTVAVYPTGANAHMGLAEILLSRGDWAAARKSAERVGALGSNAVRANAYDMLGMLYGRDGDLDKSHEFYHRVLGVEPMRSSAWLGLGNIEWLRGNLTEAQRLYKTAIKHNEHNYEALVNMGSVCEALGEDQEALHYRELAQPLRNRRNELKAEH